MDPVQPKASQSKPSKRPPGEIGGHTVQPGEQPDTDAPPSGSTSRETPPPTKPLSPFPLRDEGPPPEMKAPAQEGAAQPSASGEKPSLRMREPLSGLDRERLVEDITASLAEMLARALRQSVEQGVEKALAATAPRDASHSAQHLGAAAGQAAHEAQLQKPERSQAI